MILRGISSQIKTKFWVRGIFVFIATLLSLSIYAQVPWIEDFSGLGDGTQVDPGPTAWSRDVSAVPVNGHFEVRSNAFEANYIEDMGIFDEAVWISQSIDISSVTAATISLDISSSSWHESVEDWIRGTYEINGSGTEIEFFNEDGNISGIQTIQQNNLQGNSIIIRVYSRNGASNETYYFDNVSVTEFTPVKLYSRSTGNWNTTNTWSLSSGGPSCSCTPDAATEVYIQSGHQIFISTDVSAYYVRIENGGLQFSATADLTIENGGGMEINSGSFFSRNGHSSNLFFDNGSSFDLIVNDNSPGIDINEITINNIASLTISGTGTIDVRDDIEFIGGNAVVTNNLVGALTIGDGSLMSYLIFNQASSGDNNHLINNGSISIDDGILVNDSDHAITNNGTFSFVDINANNENITIENTGVISQSGNFNNFDGSEIIRNNSGGTWNWGGSFADSDLQLYCNFSANTFTYNHSGNQNIISPQDAYWNLSLSGTGTKEVLSSLDINGNVFISSGLDVNSYDLSIAGNWTNTGTFTESDRIVTFDGTTDQNIANAFGESFYDLEINKAGGGLILDNNVQVTNSLTLSQGNITTNANVFYLSNASASNLIYTNGHVIGRFERAINSTSTYLFPLGDALNYHPLQVTPSTINSSGSLIGFFTGADPGEVGLSVTDNSGPAEVYHQFREGYWTLTANNGVNLSNYGISLSTVGFSTFVVDNATRVIDRTGVLWNDPISGSHGTFSAPYVNRNGLSISSGSHEFGIGHPVCGTINITSQPATAGDQCLGVDINYKVVASGAGIITYKWLKDGTPISDGAKFTGTGTDSLTISNIIASDAGNYRCVITNICSTDTTNNNLLSIDGEDPTISCPSNLTQDNAAGLCTADVIGLTPITGDNCGIVLQRWTLTGATSGSSSLTGINDASGQTFNLDTTIVTYYIEDSVGNNATCNFEVRIRDTVDPVITGCVSDTNITLDASCNYLLSDYTGHASLTYTDCSSIVVSQNPLAGTTISDTTILFLIVTDKYGNADSCSFIINTNDTIKPVINSCVPDTNAYHDASCNFTLPDYTGDAAISITECSSITTVQSPIPGTVISDTTQITLTVTDEYGNLDSCKFWVNTIDTINPVINTCAADKDVILDASCNFTLPDYTGDAAISITECSSITTVQSPIPGTVISDTTQITLTVTDEYGNLDSCKFWVNTIDTINPVINTCAADKDVILDAGCNFTLPDYTGDAAISITECSSITTVQSPIPGTVISDTTQITLTVTDEYGNLDSCKFWVNTIDTINPVINTCAADKDVILDAGCNFTLPDYTGDAAISITECSSITTVQSPIPGTVISDTTQITLTVTDEYGNLDSCKFWVNTLDTINPVINTCAADKDVILDAGCNFTLPDYTGDAAISITECSSITTVQSPIPGTVISDTTQITLTVTDEYGNLDSCKFWVNTIDTINPVINTCAADKDVILDAGCNFTLPDYTGDAAISITECSSITTVQSPIPGTIISDTTQITLTVTDEYGNLDSCKFWVNTIDTINPVINTCATDKDVFLDAGCNFTLPDYTGDAAISITECSSITTVQSPIPGTVISDTTQITLTVTDEYGNLDSCKFWVNTIDTISPVITVCPADTTLPLNASCQITVPNLVGQASATDNCAASILITQFPIAGTLISSGENTTHNITITANDGKGNTTTCIVVLTGNDTIDPVFSAVPGDITEQCATPLPYADYTAFSSAGGSATDNCGINAASFTHVSDSSHANSCPQTITRIYRIADNGGNSTDYVQTININDTIAPTASNPSSVIVKCKSDIPVPDVSVVTDEADNCDPTPEVTWVKDSTNNGIGSTLDPFIVTRTYRITDDCGNTQDVTQTISVIDNISPVAVAKLPFTVQIDIQTGVAAIDVSDVDDGSFDNCGIDSMYIDIDTFYCDDIGAGPITVKLTVTDTAGNKSAASTSVTVTGYNTNPIITAALTSDTVLCSGDFFNVALNSNSDLTTYSWSFSAHSDITGWTNDTAIFPENGDTVINQQLINTGDTARKVTLTIKSRLFGRCNLPPSFDQIISFWVIPPLKTDLQPSVDTICSGAPTSVQIGSNQYSSYLRFKYKFVPVNADSVVIGWVNANDSIGRQKGNIVRDTITNLSSSTQLVYLISSPYIVSSSPAISYCEGESDSTLIWIEPRPKLGVSISDTIVCDSSDILVQVTDLVGSTFGTKLYELVSTNAGGNVIGVQASGEYAVGADINNTLINLTNEVQTVTYQFIPKIRSAGADCGNQADTTISIYVNPTPQLNVTVADTIFCDSSTINIIVNDDLAGVVGSKVYQLTTSFTPGAVLGVQASGEYAAATNISDFLVNTTNQVQTVTYNFKARIRDDRTGHTGEYCSQGGDTTITIYINPTPRLNINIADTIFCDSSTINITVNDNLAGVVGSKVYQLTTSYTPGTVLGVQASGEYAAATNISDFLVNTTNQVQTVTYNFKARIADPRGDASIPYCSEGADTTLTIYVNPTPRLNVTIADTIFCDSSTINITVNDDLVNVLGSKVYQLTTSYTPGTVLGVQASGEYAAATNISDFLVNTTNQVQTVTYNFKARIRDDRPGHSGEYCSQGGDTTITIYINPTPRLNISIADTIFCDSTAINITVNDNLGSALGTKVYQLTTSYSPGTVLGVQASGEYTAATNISDFLVNTTNQVQTVTYNFKARIADPRGDASIPYCSEGADTTLTIYVNPTPQLNVTIADTIFCDSSTINITVNDDLAGVMGAKVYQLTTSYMPGTVLGVQASGEYAAATNISDFLVNTTNQVQTVTYNFKARIRDDRPGHSGEYCSQGGDTTITIYINPTPRLSIIIADTVFCDSSTINIAVNDDISGILGTKVYQLTTSYTAGAVLGVQASGEYAADTDISDVLVNTTNSYQIISYHFKARVRDDRAGHSGEYCSQGGDTTLYIYLEPTARVHFDRYQDTICNGLDFNPITLKSVSVPVFDVRFDYQIVPKNPLLVNYSYNGANTDLSRETVISDNLINLSDTIQEVLVVVTPHLLDALSASRCYGISDTIVIQLTPSLVMQDSARNYVKYNIDCYGNSTGAIYMYPTGGILAFGTSEYDHRDLNYDITGPGVSLPLNDSSAANVYKVDDLPAGAYTITTTDFSGCSSSSGRTLTQSTIPLNVDIIEVVPIICDVDQGVVSVSKSGGTFFTSGPNTIGYETAIWTKYGFGSSVPLATDTLSQAYTGEYIVSIQDTNGCIAHDTTILAGLGAPNFAYAIQSTYYGSHNISCTGSSDGGFRALGDIAGQMLYYDLANSDSSIFISDSAKDAEVTWDSLPAGDYSLSVYNVEGCKTSVVRSLIEPADTLKINNYSISWFHDSTWNVSCNWAEDGFIHLESITGGRGAGAYQFNWDKNNIHYSSIEDLDAISFGTYKVVVNDGYCFDSIEYNMIAPDLIEYSNINPSHNMCFSDSTGSIEVTAQGGELFGGNYTYQWSHNPALNSNIANNLQAGQYIVATIDSINCAVIDTITLVQPEELVIQKSTSDFNGYEVSCFGGNNGEITVNVLGGTGLKNYNWVQGAQSIPGTTNINSLLAGTYSLTVSDQNACEASDTTILAQPERLSVDFNVKDKICKVLGEVAAGVTGGVRFDDNTYQYNWVNGSETTATITGLLPGSYPLEVTDKNACVALDTAIVGESSSMSIELAEDKPVTCFGFNDGILSLSVDNATPPLTITWNEQTGGQQLENVAAGTYIIAVSDQNECRESDTITVSEPEEILANFTVEPASCYDTADGNILLDAMGGDGIYTFVYNGSVVAGNELSDLPAGNYSISILDSKDCQTDTAITITQPDSLIINEVFSEIIKPSCPDSPDGQLSVSTEGGTEPYSFNWLDDNVEHSILNNIDEGYYRIRASDINGCYKDERLFLEAEMPACLAVPTLFSPNGDSYNDSWEIVNPLHEDMDLTLIYPELLVKIYNRWGHTVWTSERGYPKSKAWMGKDGNGRNLPVESYHYIIYLNNNSGRTLNGIVTIVK